MKSAPRSGESNTIAFRCAKAAPFRVTKANHAEVILSSILGVTFLLASLGCPAICPARDWTEIRQFGPFACHADFPLREVEGVLNGLARLQQDLVDCLDVPPAAEPIQLYLLRDEPTYRVYMSHYFPELPYRRALYIKRGGPGMVFAYRSRDFEIDLRHESTHALLHASLPMVPLWLDEGLAEYFELPSERQSFDNPHLRSVVWSLRFRRFTSIESLESRGDMGEMGGAQYRDAWAWTHFMLHGPPEARAELVGFLADIRRSTPPGLLSQRLASRVPDLRRRYADHFANWKRK